MRRNTAIAYCALRPWDSADPFGANPADGNPEGVASVARMELAESGMIGATKPRITLCFMRATLAAHVGAGKPE
jgi:hypothetical protein